METELTQNELLSLIGLMVPVLTAIVTGYFAYRIGARKDATTTQQVLHGGFKILIDELQAERDRLAAQLSKVIDDGNIDMMQEINARFTEIESRIEHNRRNADHNFGIINEIIQDQIDTAPGPGHAKRRRRIIRIVPQRLKPGDDK